VSLGDAWWEDNGYIPLPEVPEPTPLWEGPMFGQDEFVHTDFGDESLFQGDLSRWYGEDNINVELPDVVAYTGDPGAVEYFGDQSLYDWGGASLYEAPDLSTAVRVSTADVLRGSYEPTAEEWALADQAVADITATRAAGGDWQGVLGSWGASLGDVLRSALPAIVNRVLGQSPSGGVVVQRGAVAGGMNLTPILIVGGILVAVMMLGAGGRGHTRAAVSRARPRRAPARRRR